MKEHRLHNRSLSSSSLLFVGLAVILAGCTVGPNYKRPAVNAPSVYRQPAEAAATTPESANGSKQAAPAANAQNPVASLGDERWWEVFQDKELQALIRTALKNNYDVRIAATRVLQAQAQLGITRADQLPSVSVGGNITSQQSANSGPIPSFEVTQGQLNASAAWNLDFWGRYRRATEAARANLLASEWAQKEVVSTLVASVAIDYFLLRQLDLQLEISKRTLSSRQDSLRLTQTLEQHGINSLLDVRQSEQLVYTAATQVPDLERQIAQEENAISILLGKNPGDVPRGLKLTEQPHAAEVPTGLPSSLLQRRPDILQAEQNLVAANAQIGVARAAYFPQIALTGSAGYQSPALTNLFTWTGRHLEFGWIVLPTDIPGRQAQIECALGRGPARAVTPDVSTSHSGRVSRCLKRTGRVPQEPGIQDPAGTSGGSRWGCRAPVRSPLQSWDDRLSGSTDEQYELFFR